MATYLIEFDILAGHNPGTGATLTPPVLNLMGWRSIGDSGGGRFINRTGGVIRAIYLKVNGTTNAFQVTSASGGKLFNTIWAKQTGPDTASEAYFMDANVPSFGAFWMRVPPNTQQEIGLCDSGQECPFMGQAFAQNPAAPTGPGWTKIRSPLPQSARIWGDLITATPSDYRQIDSYGQTPDGQNILFLSQGELLHYDDRQKAVSLVHPPKVGTAPLVNSIVFDAAAGDFNLLHNGVVVSQVKVNPPGMTELGRAV